MQIDQNNQCMDVPKFSSTVLIKTEVIVFVPKEEHLIVSTELQLIQLETRNQVLDLGVTTDSDLNL